VLRFLGCLSLARLDFRLDMHEVVSCSDASTTGGGICASVAPTAFGKLVSQGSLRGELAENRSDFMVLTVGLFDGIGALRVALDSLGVQVIGHISVEKEASARRVVEAHYPGTVTVEDVELITEEMVQCWSTMFSQASLVLLGAGPPCQGVSGLNADRKGAIKDQRSCLFSHVPRVRGLLKRCFVWCPVYTLMESVASMDTADRETMSKAVGVRPISCNSGSFTWCQRPRLYWVDWEIDELYVEIRGNGPLSRSVYKDASQSRRSRVVEGSRLSPPCHFRPSRLPGLRPSQAVNLRGCIVARRRRCSVGAPTSTASRPISTVLSTA
jgi:hypothetical protein